MNPPTIETKESDTPRSDKCINEFRPGCLDFAWPLTVLCHQLERELTSESKDAERYRWMRDKENSDRAEYFAGLYFGEELDAAIDEEIRRLIDRNAS